MMRDDSIEPTAHPLCYSRGVPSVFLSHSSADKPFAYRLATDLITLGFSVWLDVWELRIGDPLLESLLQGIETSAWVLLLVSPHSVASGWVAKEIEAALELERRRSEVALLPLVIEKCELPEAVSGRLFLDFSSYRQALEKLESRLRQAASREPALLPHQMRLPLVLDRGLYLNRTAFEQSVRNIRKAAPPDFKITPEQILVAPDIDYDELRNHLLQLLDRYPSAAEFNDELYQFFNEAYDEIRRLEQLIPAGIALILSWSPDRFSADPALLAEAVRWFLRIVRNRVLSYLRRCAFGHGPIDGLTFNLSLKDYGKDCVTMTSDQDIRRIFSLEPDEKVTRFDLMDSRREPVRWTHFAVPRMDAVEMGFDDPFVFFHSEPADTAILPHVMYKFLLPQMVYHHLRNNRVFFPSLAGLWIGIS